MLDHPLVEFACGLPAGLRLRSGETKYLLKRVLKGRIPDEVLTRPKQGFAVPLEAWFAQRLPGFFRDLFGDMNRLAVVGIKPSSVRALIDLYVRKRRQDHCKRLWTLVVLDQFLRKLSEVMPPGCLTGEGLDMVRQERVPIGRDVDGLCGWKGTS